MRVWRCYLPGTGRTWQARGKDMTATGLERIALWLLVLLAAYVAFAGT